MLFSRGEMWRETRHAWQPFFRAVSGWLPASSRRLPACSVPPPMPVAAFRCAPSGLVSRLACLLQDVIESTGPLMSDSAARLCRHLGAAADAGRGVDVWRELGRMTMDVVGTCAFGWAGGLVRWLAA